MNLRALGTWVVVMGCALSTFSEPLKLVEQKVEIPERGFVTGYLASVGTNHFSFLSPPQWHTSHRPGTHSLAIMSPDRTTSISIDVTPRKPDEPRPKRMELLIQQFPDDIIGEGVRCQTGLGPARAYDLQRKSADGVRLTSRVIHAFTPSVTVQFTLTGPTGKFLDHTTAFANVVNSFHAPRR